MSAMTSLKVRRESAHAEMQAPSKQCLAPAPGTLSNLEYFREAVACLSIGSIMASHSSTALFNVYIGVFIKQFAESRSICLKPISY